MVEAGAAKICTAHLNPRCWTEANWIIDDAKQAKRILNLWTFYWNILKPVSWTSKTRCLFWTQLLIESSLWNSSRFFLSAGTTCLVWLRASHVSKRWSHLARFACRCWREFWRTDRWIFNQTPKWEWHNAGCLHEWLWWDDWIIVQLILWAEICQGLQFRCAAPAGRGGMEAETSLRWRSSRRQKECVGVYFNGFPSGHSQDWLPEQINRSHCERDSSCLAQAEACMKGW